MRQRRRRGGGWLCVALACSLATAPRAHAEDAAAKQVEKLAAEAIVAYKAADYTRTVELLERAYAIRQVAALLYNLAKAYEKLGEQDKAVELYRRYSDSSDADPKLRVKAEARVAAWEEARRPHKDPGTEGTFHPRPDATPDPAGDTKPPIPKNPPPSLVTPEERALHAWQARRKRDRIIGLTVAGVGVASAAAGLGLAIHASQLQRTYANGTGPEAERRALRDDATHQALAADVLFAVGAVGAGVGAYFIWRGYHPEKPPAAARVTSFAPVVSPVGAGVVLGGAF